MVALALAGQALEAALAVGVEIEPIQVRCSAYLKVVNDPQAGTMIVIDLDFDLPGAVPLGPHSPAIVFPGG